MSTVVWVQQSNCRGINNNNIKFLESNKTNVIILGSVHSPPANMCGIAEE